MHYLQQKAESEEKQQEHNGYRNGNWSTKNGQNAKKTGSMLKNYHEHQCSQRYEYRFNDFLVNSDNVGNDGLVNNS